MSCYARRYQVPRSATVISSFPPTQQQLQQQQQQVYQSELSTPRAATVSSGKSKRNQATTLTFTPGPLLFCWLLFGLLLNNCYWKTTIRLNLVLQRQLLVAKRGKTEIIVLLFVCVVKKLSRFLEHHRHWQVECLVHKLPQCTSHLVALLLLMMTLMLLEMWMLRYGTFPIPLPPRLSIIKQWHHHSRRCLATSDRDLRRLVVRLVASRTTRYICISKCNFCA